MDTRLLYIIALSIAVLSGLFYFYSGKSKNIDAKQNQDVSYSATQIYLIKTDETGQLSATTKADRLQHWEQGGLSKLDHIQTTWYQKGKAHAVFKADQALGYNDNEKVILKGHVIAQQLATANTSGITFTTTQLTGYPKTKRMETDQPVLIQTNQGQFSSQSLDASLNEGQYNFNRIRGQYAPASGS